MKHKGKMKRMASGDAGFKRRAVVYIVLVLSTLLLINVILRIAGAASHVVSTEAEAGQVAGNASILPMNGASGSNDTVNAVRFGTANPLPQLSKRNSPLSPSGSLGQFNLSSKSYIMAFRFVLDKQASIDRWYFAINGEGASCIGGRTGYGSGNGGTHYGRIVEVDQATGFPTGTVLASESVNACTAHNRAKSEYDLSTTHQLHYVQFSPVSLSANKMYAFLLSNTDANPGSGGSASSGNHMSPNMNFGDLAAFGPNARNTLDADTPGAVYGLDPRETTMWSKDGGASWLFGDKVGWYQVGSGEAKFWIVGYRPAGGQAIAHGWPFMNWPDDASGQTVTFRNAPKAVTLTHAGGSSESSAVGTITVTNTSTGVSATTSSLGSGMVSGQLSKPVPVAAGQSYTVKASGSVEMGGSTSGQGEAFGLGSRAPWNYSSSTSGRFPALYASPHPYY